MSHSEAERAVVRQQMLEAEKEWMRRKHWCECPHPIYVRVYRGQWSCKLCEKLTRQEAV